MKCKLYFNKVYCKNKEHNKGVREKKMTHFQSAPMKLDTHLLSSFSYRQNGAKMS